MTCNSLECICVDTSRCINRGTWGGREAERSVPHRQATDTKCPTDTKRHIVRHRPQRGREVCAFCVCGSLCLWHKGCVAFVCVALCLTMCLCSAIVRGTEVHRGTETSVLLPYCEAVKCRRLSTRVQQSVLPYCEAQRHRHRGVNHVTKPNRGAFIESLLNCLFEK